MVPAPPACGTQGPLVGRFRLSFTKRFGSFQSSLHLSPLETREVANINDVTKEALEVVSVLALVSDLCVWRLALDKVIHSPSTPET